MAKKKYTHAMSRIDAERIQGGPLGPTENTAILDHPEQFSGGYGKNDQNLAERPVSELNKEHKEREERWRGTGMDAGLPISGDDLAKMGTNRLRWPEYVDTPSGKVEISEVEAPQDRAHHPNRTPLIGR